MSSALLPPGQSKPWWSRSKPVKDATGLKLDRPFPSLTDDDERPSTSTHHGSSKPKDPTTGLRFNHLASAMGFKSKKLSTLAIQDPPPSMPPFHRPTTTKSGRITREPTSTTPSQFYTNRPPAASVSSVRSVEYDGDELSDQPISEPRTPSDHPRDRMSYQNSVLTMSEMDPFAAGSIIIRHPDSNRLSAYSDSSLLDPHHQKGDMIRNSRISYASSSSNSHGHMFESHIGRPPSSRLAQASRLPSDPSTRGDRRRHDSSSSRVPDISAPPADSQRTHGGIKSPNSSNSSCSTVTPGEMRNRLSEPPGGTRLPHVRLPPANMRARGMTMAATGNGKDSRLRTTSDSLGPSSSSHSLLAPLQLRPEGSASSSGVTSPSSPTAPSPLSPSPITFARSNSTSGLDSPVTPSLTRPLVLVRKASTSMVHLPPPSRAPPVENLPPPPSSPFLMSTFEDSVEDLAMAFPEPPSSSSSSVSFASSLDLDEDDSVGDAISHLMRNDFSSSKREARSTGKGSHRHHRPRRNDSDLSPSATVRNFEVNPDPGPSTRRLPPLSIADLAALSLDQSDDSRSSPRVLKKVASQQSLLGKRHSGASQSSSAASFSMGQDDASSGKGGSSSGKSPRKQRSFHHSRLPLPPLPTLRHANSYGAGNPLDVPSNASHVSERRGSVTNPSTPSSRKRLFSGSSIRRSTSSQAPNSPSTSIEDDRRSVFSLEETRPTSSSGQKIVMSFGNFGSPLSLLTSNACVAPSSFWNDSPSVPSCSQANRVSQSEYTPQHIISPADMLKLEQQLADEAEEQDHKPKLELQPGDFGFAFIGRRQRSDSKESRSRTDSMLSDMSTGTLAFGNSAEERGVFGEVVVHGSGATSLLSQPTPGTTRQPPPSPSKSKHLAEASRLPLRTTSMLAKTFSKHAMLSARPSTAQPTPTTPTSPAFSAFSRSPERSSAGLPPPPRSRVSRDSQPGQADPAHKRSSLVPLYALSPPPVRSKIRRPHTSSDSSDHQSSAPPSSFDTKVTKRRSIMKKPSFLDIEDELEATTENLLDVDVDPPASPVVDGSFLDMDRGKDSFDTLRSSDSGFYV
ncbi:hypothetical protein B0H21DRAFT_720241 [Amylocystis lapponica]|nr:hypothetical protein B0H21DRAFT_720241 [Amylocystis lapponica]